MSKQKSASADKQLVKIGHAVTPAAHSLLSMMADLDSVPESVLIEMGIRAIFDARPQAHQTALSTLLRAKGYSIRDLRKSDRSDKSDATEDETIQARSRGEVSAPAPASPPPAPQPAISGKAVVVDTDNVAPGIDRRTELVTMQYEKAVAPFDHVLAKHGESDLA